MKGADARAPVLGSVEQKHIIQQTGFTQKLSCFFHAVDDTDNDNNMLFCSGNLRFFLSTSQINQCAKIARGSEQKGSENRRKAVI